ncbi:division/cell wall cluster transcriptional repressor MraZ [Salinimicrobium soli]|uniref:division/cell wall cluster transcriptional repressor MraZ n=1 Tax=Salinimicrobium soli TaxID=1254399 RepID=UPI003AAEDE81
MVNLIGTYECKVDAKGRLMVPAPIKKQMEPILHEGFVLKRSVFQPCLELYPMERWNELMKRMASLNRFDPKIASFIRQFTAGVKMVEVDGNGRLLIPKDLIRIAGIEKEIVLTAPIDIIEIWDKNKYENVIDTPQEEFAKLAQEVMGNTTINVNELP